MKHHLQRRDDLGEWLNGLGLVNEGAEIGVASGAFSEIILSKWKGRMLHLVDLWKQQPPQDYLETTNADAPFAQWHEQAKDVARKHKRAVLHKGYSHVIANEFPNGFLEFVYIDANHSYDWVRKDIDAWWPKLKQNGVMLGHDYYDDLQPPNHCEVKRAVLDWTSTTVERSPLYITNETCPTWYVFKQPAP